MACVVKFKNKGTSKYFFIVLVGASSFFFFNIFRTVLLTCVCTVHSVCSLCHLHCQNTNQIKISKKLYKKMYNFPAIFCNSWQFLARRGILAVYLLLVSLHSTACDHTTTHCTAITKLSCTVLHKATPFCTVLHYPNYGVLFCITLRPSLPHQPPQAVSQTPAGVWQDSASN